MIMHPNHLIFIDNIIETSTATKPSYWIVDASLNRGRSEFGSALLTNRRIIIGGGFLNSTIVTSASDNYSSSFGWQITTSMKASRY